MKQSRNNKLEILRYEDIDSSLSLSLSYIFPMRYGVLQDSIIDWDGR